MKCKNNLLGKAYNKPIHYRHKLVRIMILTSMFVTRLAHGENAVIGNPKNDNFIDNQHIDVA